MSRALIEAARDLDRIQDVIRTEAVTRLRAEGKTFVQIGKALGISKSRAHQLWEETKDEKKAAAR